MCRTGRDRRPGRSTGRATRWRGRLALVAVTLVLVQWVVYPVSVAVFAVNRVPTPLPGRTPADVGLPYEDVSLTTGDGVTLRAWYVPSGNGAALFLLHGSGSNRADVLDHAEVADWLPLQPAGFGRRLSTVFYAVQDTAARVLSGTRPPTDLRSATIASTSTPVLLITGGEVAREGVAGRRLRDAAPDRVELWEVPEAHHTGGLATDRQRWASRVDAFLDETLLEPDGAR
ncbi:hypothetical protein FTX61_11905 [Nitriliruptoraceae bacterium ZYF776]|nr:hypothetical protein [Profundirhabdus halotolerans]